MNSLRIRPMQAKDLSEVLLIQSQAHPPELHESEASFRAKMLFSPQTCWVAAVHNQIHAYLFAHPWLNHTLPALDEQIAPCSGDKRIFYIHDLAIAPHHRQKGLAQALLKTAFEWAQSHQYALSRLVAIEGSESFWCKQGFKISDNNAYFADKLQSYGCHALCMDAKISAG